MSEIFGNTTTTPIDPSLLGGSGSGGTDKFADVNIEKQGNNISKIILDILKNAITGDPLVDTITPVFELVSDPYDNGEFAKLILRYGAAELAGTYVAKLVSVDTDGKIEIAPVVSTEAANLLDIYGEPVSFYPVAQIVSDIIFARDKDGNPIRILNVADPEKDLDVANKGYVDRAVGDIETALDSLIAIQNELISEDIV